MFASCDDFLEKKPKDKVVLLTYDDYDRLLNDEYSNLTLFDDICFMTDDVFFPDTDPTNASARLGLNAMGRKYVNLYTFEENVFGDNPDNSWNFCYNTIYTFNTVLNGVLSASKGTKVELEGLYGEALLARAFQYHQLLLVYSRAYNPEGANDNAGVPLILYPDAEPRILTRASVDSVYNLIINDTKQAITMLPDSPEPSAFRGSRYAAQAFLARVYLHRGDFKNALEYAELSLKEYAPLINLNNYEIVDSTLNVGRNNVPLRQDNPESVYIWHTPAREIMSNKAYVSQDLVDLFDQENDRRFKLYVTEYFNNVKLDYFLWIPAYVANIGIGTPEVYLTAAECNARLGNLDRAMELLNKLRENRYENYIPLTASSQKEAIKLVLEERRRELMMIPGIRLGDIKRLSFDPDFKQSIVRTALGKNIEIKPNSNKLTLQIPKTVMDFNPDMEQNSRVD